MRFPVPVRVPIAFATQVYHRWPEAVKNLCQLGPVTMLPDKFLFLLETKGLTNPKSHGKKTAIL